ncbi:MAG: DUF222 domain-containing protein [Demequinaceae bacterium]|nr:DUF222 domain-containing protein [Demequinaceae bacterium]
MSFQTDSFRRGADAVCSRQGVDVAKLPEPDLIQLSSDVARVRRDADVLMAVVAAEIRRRSETVGTGTGLASHYGYRSARDLVAQATGGSLAEARRLMSAGDLLADGESLALANGTSLALADGETATGGSPTGDASTAGDSSLAESPSPMTRFRSDLALAVREGHIGIDAAALFTDAIAALSPAATQPNLPPDITHPVSPTGGSDPRHAERTYALFTKALTKATGLPLYQVRKLVWQAQAFSDPDAWRQREEHQHDSHLLTIKDDTDGMVTLTARLTPLAAAPVRAVLDAGVRSAIHARRDNPDTDPRSPWQMRADILTDLCRHALDCDHATSGVKTTVVVRMTLADLESGLGLGEIDGMPQPVSVGALRQAAADAQIIPAVLGEASDILDWGRSRRLFTPTQRLALVERDGGCAWCNSPPTWCEAHHIRWWERDAGPTDLANAVLMCARCHHRIHRDGWNIEIHDHVVHFIPPATIDPTQTPHLGGRTRYELSTPA